MATGHAQAHLPRWPRPPWRNLPDQAKRAHPPWFRVLVGLAVAGSLARSALAPSTLGQGVPGVAGTRVTTVTGVIAAGRGQRRLWNVYQPRQQRSISMQVILLERIGRLGQMGDVVNVKDGYARNFLLPQKKALRATPDNKARFEKDRAQLEARDLELKKEAEAVAAKLVGKTFLAIRQAGDTGQLYGSVTTRDIAELVTSGGFHID